MDILNKKLFRVLTCIILSIIVSVAFFLIGLKFNGTPAVFSSFACIAITVLNIFIYLLFDSETDNKSLSKTSIKDLFFFILMAVEILVCLLIVLAAAVANYGFATDNPWKIGLLYIPLAQTSITIFAFLFINNKRMYWWSDTCLIAYPFVNIVSCVVGYLLMVAVSTLGFAVEFLFLWADVILFGISIIAIIAFIKVNDIPFTYSPKAGKQNQYVNNSSSVAHYNQQTQEYSTQPDKKSGGREVFFKWLKDYCYRWSSNYTYPNYSNNPEYKIDEKLKLYTWSNIIEITINTEIIVYRDRLLNKYPMYITELESSMNMNHQDMVSENTKKIKETVLDKIDELREKYTGLDEAWSIKIKENFSQEVE